MSQFVKAACRVMERIAPLRLSEPWDNVGLLLEVPPSLKTKKNILLTIDLTPAVAAEAITSEASLIIAYHPPIFRPLSSLTLSNPLQRSLIQLTQHGVSLYSPHTALDSVRGGVNDWLAEAFISPSDDKPDLQYIKDKNDDRGGSGRLLTLPDPGLALFDIVRKVQNHLGIRQAQIAKPYEDENRWIRTIAICAGSGGSMFEDVDADLYFTGEMQHHDILAAKAKNRFILLCGHTNTERGYLKVLRQKLLAEKDTDTNLEGLDVQISETDEHPLAIVGQ